MTKSPSVAKIADELRRRITTGTIRQGRYLASVRNLSAEFGCAPLTAHRALKQLAVSGFVVAEPRHGYRVTHASVVQEVVVFLQDIRDNEKYLGDIYETQLAALQRGALSRGWISATLPYTGQPIAAIEHQLREMKATALLVQDLDDSLPASLPAALKSMGLPIIGLDFSGQTQGLDQVHRDEAQGAGLAAAYLLRRGHRHIDWYGPLKDSPNARRRFAGAAEELLHSDIVVDDLAWREIALASETAVAMEFLKRNRPRAVLALWQTAAQAIARAARELGLRLGHDLDLAGWALEEQIGQIYPGDCPELLAAAATVTWSMTDVAHLVFNRIESRHRDPTVPPARLLLPMKLREPIGRLESIKG